MFSSSVRRAAFAAQPSPLVNSISTTGPRAVSTQALSYRRTHQRRSSSSSKPPSPTDGPKGISDGQAVTGMKKSGTSSSQQKAKDVAADCTVKARDETMQNLPSVPSTHHVKSKGNSSFFSVCRKLHFISAWLTFSTRNCCLCILFSPPPNIRYLKLPKNCHRRRICRDIHHPEKVKVESYRCHIYFVKYSQ
jgi:hypothetical protein